MYTKMKTVPCMDQKLQAKLKTELKQNVPDHLFLGHVSEESMSCFAISTLSVKGENTNLHYVTVFSLKTV